MDSHRLWGINQKQDKSEGFDSCDRPSNLTQIGFQSSIFQPVWPWNFMDDLKKQSGTSSILREALCIISNPSVNLNWSYSRKMLNSGHIGDILSCVTLKFDGWPWKTIGHLSYAASSFVHHFIDIGEFKLELQSGNAQFGSKLGTFFSRVTLKFDGWPRKTIGHLCQWCDRWKEVLRAVWSQLKKYPLITCSLGCST